jgi:hypothetical protein
MLRHCGRDVRRGNRVVRECPHIFVIPVDAWVLGALNPDLVRAAIICSIVTSDVKVYRRAPVSPPFLYFSRANVLILTPIAAATALPTLWSSVSSVSISMYWLYRFISFIFRVGYLMKVF